MANLRKGIESFFGDAGQGVLGGALPAAAGVLTDRINQQGFNPAALNFQLADINQTGVGLQERVPTLGPNLNAGATAALRAGLASGTAGQRSQAIATEQQSADQRIMQALQQAFGLLNPAIGAQGSFAGQDLQQAQMRQQMIAAIASGLGGAAGTVFGGPIGGALVGNVAGQAAGAAAG
jgi:hypothetical protein